MKIKLFLLLTFFYTLTSPTVANEQYSISATSEVNAVTIESQRGKTVLVFDVNGAFDYKVFALASPDRLVIDISNISSEPSVTNLDLKNSPINKIRTAQRTADVMRVVLDLEHEVSFKHSTYEISNQSGSRLVIDLYNNEANDSSLADKSDQKIVMLKEQAAKEKAAKEQAAKEKAAKERAAKERAAKERAAKERAAKERAAKERAAKERAAKAQAAKERAAKERAAKETALSSQSDKNQARPLNNEQNNFFVSYGAGITYSNNCKSSFAGEVSAGVKLNEQFSTQISHLSAYCYLTVSNRTSFNTTHSFNELSFRYTPRNSVTFFEYGLASYNLKNSPSTDTPVLGVGMKYDGTYWNGEIEFKIYPVEDDTITYTGASLNSYF
jgi:flagellar biosynthesis GTPase FlhF